MCLLGAPRTKPSPQKYNMPSGTSPPPFTPKRISLSHAGVKLGHKVPWVNGFPFNVVPHPQYVGSSLSVWGMAALVWGQGPPGIGLLAFYWTMLYIITGYQEAKMGS